jgi:hypothetical protein
MCFCIIEIQLPVLICGMSYVLISVKICLFFLILTYVYLLIVGVEGCCT